MTDHKQNEGRTMFLIIVTEIATGEEFCRYARSWAPGPEFYTYAASLGLAITVVQEG